MFFLQGERWSSIESDDENTFQPVQEYESVLVQKVCEVCGNPFQAFEIDKEEDKKPLLTTCEMCSYYIPPHRMDLENKTQVCNVYQCDKCLKSFARKDGLERHRITHIDCRPFRCKMCHKCFKRNDKLIEHIKVVHSKIGINKKTPDKTCNVCGEQDAAITVFVENKALKFCEKCNLSKKERINSSNNESKLFQCDLCSRNFSRKDHAVRHRLSHLDVKPFECYICQKSFNRNDRLLRHLKTHPNARPFSCKVCFQAFADRTELKNHQLTHGSSKNNLHKCDVCQKEFRDKNRLQKHLFVHEDYKPYTCEMCEKSFKLEEALLSHQREHSNRKPFKCTICGLAFKMEETLKQHLLVHSNVSINTCQICSKTFARRDKLKTHYLIHLDVRPFICSICNSAFKRKDKYGRHCKEVHGVGSDVTEVIIVCDVCGKTFNCEDDLTEHKMIHYR